ncbi:MAG: histidine kinase, partial [Bacteroidales bacterium]|nr:histidine kinase [Bacteroidales bacterium]
MSWPEMGIVEGIARDDHGNYWLGGHYGIVRFDGYNFTPFRSAPAPAEMVWGMIKDYTGSIWSAGSDGLVICDPEDPLFRPALPAADNLPANVIRDLGDRRLLVGRMLDLCIIDLEKYYAGQLDYYTIIGRSRGYTGNDCQDNGIVRDALGRWWLLTSDKLIRFDPDKSKINRQPPQTHIKKLETLTENLSWTPVLDTALYYKTDNRVMLHGYKNGVKITFTGISMKNPEDITFQYRLAGFKDNWSLQSRERTVTYDGLPPGSYTFELHSFNSDGVKTLQPETLIIDVIPTFFQTLGARIVLALLAISLIVHISFLTRRRIMEKRVETARIQAESYKMQLNSIIKQFDPHFTFNAVTSVGALIMKGEKQKAYNYFIKLSNLLRSVLTDSAVLLKPLSDELNFATRYCELQKLRFGNRFDFEIEVDNLVDRKTQISKMIIQSFVENAVKHGLENKQGAGKVKIH